jgi:tRNA-splicing ligase RtcB
VREDAVSSRLVADGKDRWRIPASGGMRVDGLVFASRRLIVKAQEDRAVDQVVNVAHLPGIVGASIAMPDIHWGYGFPIGGVAATDVEAGGVVSPGGVGFDIGCGVRLLRSELSWDEAAPRLPELVDHLAARIPRGVGGKGLRTLSEADMDGVLATGVRWALDHGIGTESDEEYCEDRGSSEGADPVVVSERAKVRGAAQLGSLGAGNHFLEVQVVEEIFREAEAKAMGLVQGAVCVMIHTGSRGIGHQTCTEQVRELERVMRRLGIEVPDRQLACAPVTDPAAERYLQAMTCAANFARANRHVLADAVRRCFEEVFHRGRAALGLDLVYDVSHNVAKLERHDVDGRSRLLCVHRKGATRALAPGHPEIPDRYAGIGQPVLVPGSMGSASYVLVGVEQGRTLAFASTCHGAGRSMSRKQAAKQMDGGKLAASLERQGILVRAHQLRLIEYEAPYSYKDVYVVVGVCERVGLSKIVARLRPAGVVKG